MTLVVESIFQSISHEPSTNNWHQRLPPACSVSLSSWRNWFNRGGSSFSISPFPYQFNVL